MWSPASGENCQVEVGSLEELRRLQAPGIEARGLSLPSTRAPLPQPGAAPLRARPAPAGLSAVDDLPPDVRRLLGWPAKDPLAPAPSPARR